MTNTAENLLPVEQSEPTTAQMIRFPGPGMDPATAEPVEYQAPPEAVLPKPKAQRKGGRPKGSRNKKDIEAAAKRRAESAARAPAADAAPAPTSLAEAGAAPFVANAPGGAALPNIQFSRSRVDTLLAIVGAFCLLAGGFGLGYLATGMGQ